jgi:hypothetical protein
MAANFISRLKNSLSGRLPQVTGLTLGYLLA